MSGFDSPAARAATHSLGDLFFSQQKGDKNMKPLDLSDKSAAFMAALAGTASWAHSPHARDVYLRLYSEQLRGDHLIDRLTRGTAFKQLGYSDR